LNTLTSKTTKIKEILSQQKEDLSQRGFIIIFIIEILKLN